MAEKDATTTFLPGPRERTVRATDGRILDVPAGWDFLPPGDPGVTRRVKAAGEFWLLQELVRRKMMSRGLWAPATTIARVRAELEVERASPAYAKKLASAARRRDKIQTEYVEDFLGAVLAFLDFHPALSELAEKMAKAVTEHATPVGSGTVARTERIPIEQRAEAAVIAWMRHQTTAYDQMVIPRIKGQRREVRRMLARRSHELLEGYRRGDNFSNRCPLYMALTEATPAVRENLPDPHS
ncbi:MAG TPA: DUF2293 domain-containing protein [Planctomycetaceae bacterium]|nr:DUF2293 domain-containing protein [Planctomycetaceae bacterium]